MRELISTLSLVLTLALSTLAWGQPGLSDAAVPETIATRALEAASRGDCHLARAFAARVRIMDPIHYEAVLAHETMLVNCRQAPKPSDPARPTRSRPPINAGRMLLQFAAGSGMGVVAGLGGAVLGAEIECRRSGDECVHSGYGETMFIFGGVGFLLGTTLGAQLVGDVGPQEGRVLATLGGAALGTFAGIKSSEEGNKQVVNIVWLAALGAVAGHTLTRRYDLSAEPLVTERGAGLSVRGSF